MSTLSSLIHILLLLKYNKLLSTQHRYFSSFINFAVPARYLNPSDADWSYRGEQDAANPQYTIKNVPHVLRITKDGKMFKEVFESENQNELDKQLFHFTPHDVTIVPESTMLPNTEEKSNVTPTRTSLTTNFTDSITNNTKTTINVFSESVTNGSEVNDMDLKKPIPVSPAGLLTLLAKLRAENKNYTLQIITT